MPKTSKANKKFAKKTVVIATPVITKKKEEVEDSLNKKKWNLDLRRINPDATWGSFLRGCRDSFLDEHGKVLEYKEGDVRFNWLQMIDQVEKLLNINNHFKNDQESRDYLEFILREILRCDVYLGHQEPVEDTEDYEVTSKRSDLVITVGASHTIQIDIADPQAVVFTPYHVHYLVNIVTTYVSKSRTEDVSFWPAGKITGTLENLHIF